MMRNEDILWICVGILIITIVVVAIVYGGHGKDKEQQIKELQSVNDNLTTQLNEKTASYNYCMSQWGKCVDLLKDYNTLTDDYKRFIATYC